MVSAINSIPTPLDEESATPIFEFMELSGFSDKELVELIKYSQYLMCEPLRKVSSAFLAQRLKH
jgi:hypothetical protein